MSPRLPICLCCCLLCTFACWSCKTRAEGIVQTKKVGPVTVITRLEPETPTIGDELSLTIEVVSDKDVEVLMPEFAEALQRYTIVDFVPRQRIAEDGRTVQTQQYTLQPYMSGEQWIPPILVEFVDHRPGRQPAPEDFDAYEILTDRIDFQVQSVVVDSSADLRPPLGDLALTEERAMSPLWWSLLILTLVGGGIAGFVYFSRVRKRAKRINAYEIAHRRLQRLLEDRQAAESNLSAEAFFVEISAIIRRYLEDRFELRAPELTTDEFLQLAATQSELSREHQNLLSEFLKQADMVKFAGVQATVDDMNRSSDLAAQFIEETRENAPDIEVDESSDDTPENRRDLGRVSADV